MSLPRLFCFLIVFGLLLFTIGNVTGCSSGDDHDDFDDDDSVQDDDDDTEDKAIDIIIDQFGVPHIFAQNDEDLFFGSGYQLATQRLFQVDINRRRATGKYAEVVGEQGLTDDYAAHTFGFKKYGALSAELVANERPEDYELLVAFVDGLNRRVDEVLSGQAEMPVEFTQTGYSYSPEHFTVADLLSSGIRTLFGHSSTMEFDILNTLIKKLMRDYDDFPVFEPGGQTFTMLDNPNINTTRNIKQKQTPLQLSAVENAELLQFTGALSNLRKALRIGEGSNQWALNGKYTENGMPFLVTDSHAHYGNPNIMSFQHLNSAEAGGNFNVIGFSFAGVPCVQIGTNADTTWGATTHFADMMDLWDISVSDGIAKIGDSMLPVDSRSEIIRIKNDDGSFSDKEIFVRSIEGYGVILPEEILPVPSFLLARGELLLNWPGFAATDEILIYFDLNRAKTLEDFESAIGMQKTGMQNWVAATKEGIRFKAHGLVPDRGPLQGRPRANEIMDGNDPTTYWTRGYLSDEYLPYLDGSQSFIVSANNDPWGHTADNDPLNDEFYYGSFYSPGYRATRMTNVLNEMIQLGPITLEESLRFHMDSYSMLAHGLIPLLEQTLADIDTDPDLESYQGRGDIAQAIQSLVDWDRMMVRESTQAALFRIWYAYLSKLTLNDDLLILFEELDNAQPVTMCKLTMLIHQQNIASLLDGKSNLLMLRSLDQALAEVETRMAASGKAEYTWGDLLLVEFDSPADVIENQITKDGGDTSMNVSQTHCWDNGVLRQKCLTTAGSVYRFAVSFTDQGAAEFRYNMPYGNTQDPDDWVEGIYRQAPMSRSETEAIAVEQYEIRR